MAGYSIVAFAWRGPPRSSAPARGDRIADKAATVRRSYNPDAGDLVWLSFDPKAGHEQGGARPVLILSSRIYNGKALLAIACPITNQVKGYPFEVLLSAGGEIAGVIPVDHFRNLDCARCSGSEGRLTVAGRSKLTGAGRRKAKAGENAQPMVGYM